MKNLIIIGNDKIAGGISEQVSKFESCIVYVDKSTNISRIIKLIKRRVISPALLTKMVVCEALRKGERPSAKFPSIHKNEDLLSAIAAHNPGRLILFRAGLIVNSSVIAAGVPVLNIHAAIVPDFGGIGSIDRAIKSRAYAQYASLHVVTTRIDEGEIIDRVDYQLDPELSYFQNEEVAYRAAQQLLLKVIQD